MGLIDARWAINEAPVQLEVTHRKKHQASQTHNLDGIPTNIYEENSPRNFRVQSEREWTLV